MSHRSRYYTLLLAVYTGSQFALIVGCTQQQGQVTPPHQRLLRHVSHPSLGGDSIQASPGLVEQTPTIRGAPGHNEASVQSSGPQFHGPQLSGPARHLVPASTPSRAGIPAPFEPVLAAPVAMTPRSDETVGFEELQINPQLQPTVLADDQGEVDRENDRDEPAWPVNFPQDPRTPAPRSDESDDTDERHVTPELASAARRHASPAIATVAQQAEREIHAGFVLANRGATFSAKNRFLKALRMIAEARDAELREKHYSAALERGFVAIEEAQDFVHGDTQQAESLDVARRVQGHRTTILKNATTQRVPPILALQHYFTYAQEQLGIAGGNVPAASSALHYLGKLYPLLDGPAKSAKELRTPKSIVFHQAALTVDANNYMAAHELGVLLARAGQWEDAKRIVLHGLRKKPQASTWRNLAIIHERLGEPELAQLAMSEMQVMLQKPQGQNATPEPIVWLSNGQFARTSRELPSIPAPMPENAGGTAQATSRSVSPR